MDAMEHTDTHNNIRVKRRHETMANKATITEDTNIPNPHRSRRWDRVFRRFTKSMALPIDNDTVSMVKWIRCDTNNLLHLDISSPQRRHHLIIRINPRITGRVRTETETIEVHRNSNSNNNRSISI